jgi:hypothetical protein
MSKRLGEQKSLQNTAKTKIKINFFLCREVKMFNDPNYGNCFTFNWFAKSHYVKRVGQKLGLRLIFNTPSSDYLPFTLPAGFAMVFHETDEDPAIGMVGIKGSPGQNYIIGIRKVTPIIVRLFETRDLANVLSSFIFRQKQRKLEILMTHVPQIQVHQPIMQIKRTPLRCSFLKNNALSKRFLINATVF